MASIERIALSPKEAAQATGLHYETILDAIHKKELKHKKVGRIYRIHRDHLNEYMNWQDQGSQPVRHGTRQAGSGSSTMAGTASAQAAATRVMSLLLKKR